ncbi:hypothetical protein [Thiosulfatihalobacter marinus]|uniref:hypothetical protein n=1 Tax=Thiosulfatihalobacter marinus TaxID=2792481 RepID=UPI002FBD944F
MASALWQGNWRTRARIISGLVLFTYVLLHYLNIGLGLFSLELMERASDWRRVVSRSMVGTVCYMALCLPIWDWPCIGLPAAARFGCR